MSRTITIDWLPVRLEEQTAGPDRALRYTELSTSVEYEFQFPPPTIYTPLLLVRTTGVVLFPHHKPLLRSLCDTNGEQTIEIGARSKTRESMVGLSGFGTVRSATVIKRVTAFEAGMERELFALHFVPRLNKPFGVYMGDAIIVVEVTGIRVKGAKWRRWRRSYDGTPSASMHVTITKRCLPPMDLSTDDMFKLCDEI